MTVEIKIPKKDKLEKNAYIVYLKKSAFSDNNKENLAPYEDLWKWPQTFLENEMMKRTSGVI